MADLLRQAGQAGKLHEPDPLSAADQFYCLIKGGANFRLLIGCGEAQQGEAAEQHVRDAVGVFLRAYRQD
jgi:TetR/AcrR family transcriptional repressor of mexJK operon